ncbi:MAG: extracellular solute-binding protein [Phycisphaerales bacterium]
MDPGASPAWSLTRRAALGAIGVAGLGVALWPRRPRAQVDVPRGRVVLRYWEKWTGTEGDAIQSVVDRYNGSQERIWVQRVPVSEIAAKAMTAIGGGDPPDLVGLYSYHVPLLAETNAAMSMDEFAGVRVASPLDQDAYVPSVRALLSLSGKQWAGVNTCYALGLYYNRGILRQAGLDPDRPPRTTRELDALADRLVIPALPDRTGGAEVENAGPMARAGFLPNLPAWWPYFWPIMFGGRLFDAATNRALMDEPSSIAAYRWVQEIASRLGPSRSRNFGNQYGRNFHSPDDPFISGKVAMIVQGPWLANFINVHAKKGADGTPAIDYAAVPVPVEESVFDPERPLGMLEADVIMIPRGCPHPEEAYEFFCYLQRRDVQERLAVMHCKSSPMRECSPGFMQTHPNPSVAVFDKIVKSDRAIVLPQTRSWQAIADLTSGAFEEIWRGADVEKTLAAVQRRAQGLLDKSAELAMKRTGLG